MLAKNGAKSKFIFGVDLTILPPPGGESLKDTAERVLPYYEAEIAPRVADGGTILVAAHGTPCARL